ncbi:MAG TPA: Txe/YoeB family addiction module toxin [Salinimicrobium sp.]|nr:Txe/YoeB family addiction module toxin [Salinimicrobium sp.]
MEIIYSREAKKDISFWKKSGNEKIMTRITKLILGIVGDPFSGIGKPEPLKHNLTGYWSRRINQEHRLVYKAFPEINKVQIYSLRGHYN